MSSDLNIATMYMGTEDDKFLDLKELDWVKRARNQIGQRPTGFFFSKFSNAKDFYYRAGSGHHVILGDKYRDRQTYYLPS